MFFNGPDTNHCGRHPSHPRLPALINNVRVGPVQSFSSLQCRCICCVVPLISTAPVYLQGGPSHQYSASLSAAWSLSSVQRQSICCVVPLISTAPVLGGPSHQYSGSLSAGWSFSSLQLQSICLEVPLINTVPVYLLGGPSHQ